MSSFQHVLGVDSCPDSPPPSYTPPESDRDEWAAGPESQTPTSAREAVLSRLLPKAIAVLEKKIEANDQDSWRAAVKLVEYGWGRPREEVDVQTETQVEGLTLDQLRALRARLLEQHPELGALRAVE